MVKGKKAVSIQVDKKYQGLGSLLNVESPILGLATNLEDTKREPFHALELFAFPDLKYGWISIPKERFSSLPSVLHAEFMSPVNRIVGWKDNNLYVLNLDNRTVEYTTTFDDSIITATFINKNTIACITNSSLENNPLKVIFYLSGEQKAYSKTGNCLTSFKGRLFIAEGSFLHFSSPHITDPSFAGNPFASENGGGYLVLNYPQVSQINYLLPKEDMLYIFTDFGLYALTVSLASNAPSSFYIIDTGINYNFSYAKVLQIGDLTVVLTNVGMFYLSGMNLERFDWAIADQLNLLDFPRAGCGFYQGQNFIFIPFLTRNMTLAYSIEYSQFFYLPFRIANCVFTSGGLTYDFSQSNARVLFLDTTQYYPFSYISVFHDYGLNRFKHIKEAWINGQGKFQVAFLYDVFGLYQTMFYSSVGPYLSNYRSSFGRKGYKIAVQIVSDDSGSFAYVNKINLKIHLLGPVNYFYYTG
jgi:hypothetical protein